MKKIAFAALFLPLALMTSPVLAQLSSVQVGFSGPEGGPFQPPSVTVQATSSDCDRIQLGQPTADWFGASIAPADAPAGSCSAAITVFPTEAAGLLIPGTQSGEIEVVFLSGQVPIADAVLGVDIEVLESAGALGFASAPILDLQLGEEGLLAARVRDGADNPVPGVTVNWAVSPESDGLGDAATISGDDGIATNTFVESRAGEYKVSASVDGVADPLVFTILVSESVSRTPQEATRAAIFDACPTDGNTPEFQATCDAIVEADVSGSEEAAEAYVALANDEVGSQTRLLDSVIEAQSANIRARLAALRHGATGVSIRGLAFDLHGIRVPGEALFASTDEDATADDDIGGGLLDNRLGIFINGLLSYGDKDGTANEEGFDFDTKGVTIGADYRFTDKLIAGAALGYATTNVDLDSDGGELDGDGYSLLAYGTYYQSQNLYLEGMLGYGSVNLDQVRRATFTITSPDGDPLEVNSDFKADPDSDQFYASFGAGYQFFADNGLTTTLFGRLNYLDADVDGYTEQEDALNNSISGMAVTIDDQSFKSTTTTVGVQLEKAFSANWGVIVPFVRAEWEHEFEDDTPVISGRFTNATPGAGLFAFDADEVDADYARVGLGASAVFPHGVAAFVNYDKLLGQRNYDQDDWSLGVRYEVRF